MEVKPLQVIVKFGPGFHPDFKGHAMLDFEKYLHGCGYSAEVLQEMRHDDLLSRAKMTPEQRAKL